MKQSSSNDVATKIQDAFRSAARGGAASRYTCPICKESSNAGHKLWEQAKQPNPDYPELTGTTEAADAKELFLEKAYVNLYRTRLRWNPSCACPARA